MLSFSLLLPLLAAVFAYQGPAKAPAATASIAPAPAAAPKAAPIPWSATRRLTLADFQGQPTPKDKLAALTAADIKAGAACRDYVFSGTVEATFDPNLSWFRDPKNSTEALLRHEQLHFDITEVYARKLRQKLTVFKVKADCNKLQPAFDNLTRAVYSEWEREESRYDQETNHGLNTAKQGYWERQVQIKLDQLKAYAL
ncbi:hypothetical protein GCM10023185_17620 [Hymenobacter saemangeumensis]|uniref:DUF922 domain-containing protein n=1 Tax=Hymenobacter saemangeumensis TaxID=1084522 RepID=A0ABP8IAW8_9BACT